MSKSKRKTIENILEKSKATESAKASYWRAYNAAHKSKARRLKPCEGE